MSQEQEAYRHLHRTEDGQYYPVQYAMPIPETSIGGSYTQPLPPPLPPRNKVTPEQLAQLSPEERARSQQIARMDPPLQVRPIPACFTYPHIRYISLCVVLS